MSRYSRLFFYPRVGFELRTLTNCPMTRKAPEAVNFKFCIQDFISKKSLSASRFRLRKKDVFRFGEHPRKANTRTGVKPSKAVRELEVFFIIVIQEA